MQVEQQNIGSAETKTADTLSTLLGAFYLPSIKTYATEINYYPGQNCLSRWAEKGRFYGDLYAYENGKVVFQYAIKSCDESGSLSMNSDEIYKVLGHDFEGLGILELRHPVNIPIDLYISHAHKKTGVYVAIPPAPFMGDQIYTTSHALQLENSLLWPGIVETAILESCLRVMNPFDVPFQYQLLLMGQDGRRYQTDIKKLKSHFATLHTIADLFPEQIAEIRADPNQTFSLCISAQYKICAQFVIREKTTGIFTNVDHLHPYCMF